MGKEHIKNIKKSMLTHYVTQKSKYGLKNGCQHLQMPEDHNYWLKYDDLHVYPQLFGTKEHIKTIKN